MGNIHYNHFDFHMLIDPRRSYAASSVYLLVTTSLGKSKTQAAPNIGEQLLALILHSQIPSSVEKKCHRGRYVQHQPLLAGYNTIRLFLSICKSKGPRCLVLLEPVSDEILPWRSMLHKYWQSQMVLSSIMQKPHVIKLLSNASCSIFTCVWYHDRTHLFTYDIVA